MPRVPGVALGEEEPLWGVGLEQGFCPLGLCPATSGLAAGARERLTP